MYQEMLARNLRLHHQRQLAARLPGRASLERVTGIYQELVKTYPGVSHFPFRALFVRFDVDLVYISREEGDAPRALEAAQRAVDLSGILSLDPVTESTRAITANCHLHLAMAAADVKQFETTARELRAADEIMRHLKQPNGLLLYNRACCLALLGRMTSASADRNEYEHEAMSALWQAFKAGYRNKRVLADDHDIDGLRIVALTTSSSYASISISRLNRSPAERSLLTGQIRCHLPSRRGNDRTPRSTRRS